MMTTKEKTKEKPKTLTIGMHSVAIRQRKESRFSHFDGSDEELIRLVEQNLPLKEPAPGGQDGVFVLPLPPTVEGKARFFTSLVRPTKGMLVKAEYITMNGLGFYRPAAYGEKKAAKYVEVILYNSELLNKLGYSPKHDYEIVSINAGEQKDLPLHPYRMACKMREGTSTFTAEDFIKAITYWTEHIPVSPDINLMECLDSECVEKLKKHDLDGACNLYRQKYPEVPRDEANSRVMMMQNYLAQKGLLEQRFYEGQAPRYDR